MPPDTDTTAGFDNELSAFVWKRKYAAGQERSISDTWRRVANAVASVEPSEPQWRDRFRELLSGFRFLPGGRILASAGTGLDATLFNCFVMGPIEDSVEGIFGRLTESALTMQRGGGIGCDFSTLRPVGADCRSSGRVASGPVSFLTLWDAMCGTLLATGNRRGAMMGVLSADHPDVLRFIDAKRTPGELTNFNLSVLVTDALMRAVDADADARLCFPSDLSAPSPISAPGRALPDAPIADAAAPAIVPGSIRARTLWSRLLAAAYDTAEPGVLFVDRINQWNNLYYRERITATNPCGEVPLPPFGACNLGSINLAALIEAPYSRNARLDIDAVGSLTRMAVRFLDDVIDVSPFPLEAQAIEARTTRRIGLGVTGLADALIMLGLRYDSEAGRAFARNALTRIRDEAYAASIDLAEEKGCFPCFERDAYLAGRYVATLPGPLRDGIARHGIRNSHLLAIAPAGSISILANNVSSGIEPVFASRMERTVLDTGASSRRHLAVDGACAVWARCGAPGDSLPPAFISARQIAPADHIAMAAALQPLVDNSISKTVNVHETISREDFGRIYREAFDRGLKGCTVFRPNTMTAGIIEDIDDSRAVHCCVPDREAD